MHFIFERVIDVLFEFSRSEYARIMHLHERTGLQPINITTV